jgi:lysophospholipase L1-like esterase
MKNLISIFTLTILFSTTIFAQNKKQHNVVIFGNSIVHQGDWEKVLDRQDVLKYGLPGQVTGQLIWNIKNVLKDYPGTKIWFLEGGINDISLGVPVKRIFENQQVIIDSLKRNNIIPVVQSTILKHNSKEDNKKVNQLNKKIKAFCEQNNVEYIDLNAFLSRNGELIMDLSTDGCHLKPQAYVPWGEAIKKVLAKLNI